MIAKTLIEMKKKDLMGLMRPYKAWVAVVRRTDGSHAFVSQTDAGLRAKVAAYCREWWEDVAVNYDDDDEQALAPPEDDQAVIQIYFDRCPDEFLDSFEEIEL